MENLEGNEILTFLNLKNKGKSNATKTVLTKVVIRDWKNKIKTVPKTNLKNTFLEVDF
jgi:hypothetical protein